MPSTFIVEAGERFCVGWFDGERKCERTFADFAEAASAYLLFSFGKDRQPLSSGLFDAQHLPDDDVEMTLANPRDHQKPWWRFWEK